MVLYWYGGLFLGLYYIELVMNASFVVIINIC